MAKRFQIEYRLYKETLPDAYVTAPDDEVGANADGLNLSYKHNGYAHYETAAASSFTIRGDFYAFVYYWLWKDTNAVNNAIECRIFDKVCNKYLHGEYYIKPAGIQFCKEDCTLDVSAKHEDLTLKCLQRTLVDTDQATNPDAAHNWFSGGLLHPEFGYCKNNTFIYAISLLALAVTILSPFGITILLPLLIAGVLDNLYERARGCDRKLPSPLITTYIENLTDNCNVSYSDTVFTTPSKYTQLNKACIFYAPVEKGIDLQDNTTLYKLTNALNYSGERFFEFLQKRFNLKWRLNPAGLLIRHFDEPYQGYPALDLSDVPDVCCEWTGKKPPSYGKYDFALDTLDTEGNASRRAYNDIVEYNDPYSPAQDGAITRMFDDSTPAFRNDGLRSDDISRIDQWFAPITALFNILNVLPNADDFVMTSGYTTSNPKVIIWDGVSNKHNAKAIKKTWSANEISVLTADGYDAASMGSQYGKTTYFYNYIMPVNDELHQYTPNTYEFFTCDNVRACPCRMEYICKFTIPTCDCDVLDRLGIYEGTDTGAIIDYPVRIDADTIGEIQGIDIDFGADTIVLTVKPTNCQSETIIVPPNCEITINSISDICTDGTAEVTITWTAINTSTVLNISVGAYSQSADAADGTVTIGVPGDGSTVVVTIEDSLDDNCFISQSYDLPYCCYDGGASMSISCAPVTCDSYFLAIFSVGVPGVGVNFISITIDGTTYTPGAPILLSDTAGILAYLQGLGLDFQFDVTLGATCVISVIGKCCLTFDAADFDVTSTYGTILPTSSGYADCATITGLYPSFICCGDFCFTATPTGSPVAVATDVIEYSYDGVLWFTGDEGCIDAGGELFFRRTITYNGGCLDTVIERRVYNVTDCNCYTIDDNAGTVVGGVGNCGGINNPCSCVVTNYDVNVTDPTGVGTFDGQAVITILNNGTCVLPITVRGVTRNLCSLYDTVNPPTCAAPDVAAFTMVEAYPTITITGITDSGTGGAGGSFYTVAVEDANGCLYGIDFYLQAPAGTSPKAYAVKSADYTITTSDAIIEVDTIGVTITLPTAVGIKGQEFIIINANDGTTTVDTTGGETIGNEVTPANTTFTLSSEEVLQVVSDGANWRII